MQNRILRCLSLVLSLLACSAFSHAQDTGQVLGTPALQKFINVGGGLDEINTGDLTIHISIPLNSKGPYGPAASASLDMDSRAYMYDYGNGNQIFTSPYFKFRSSAEIGAGLSAFSPGSGSCFTSPYPYAAADPAYDGSGTAHPARAFVGSCGITFGSVGADGWTVEVGVVNLGNYIAANAQAISPSGLKGGRTYYNPRASAVGGFTHTMSSIFMVTKLPILYVCTAAMVL